MNLTQTYDTVEKKGKPEPRPIRMGDVLTHQHGDDYVVFALQRLGHLLLGNLRDGTHWGAGVRVHDIDCLTREEASFLCGGHPENFRLIGQTSKVLTVNDPGE